MVDPRVTHLWDAGNVVDQGFLERFGVDFGGLDCDFFLLFDCGATWEQRPPRPVSSGATVIGDSDQLAESAASLLRSGPSWINRANLAAVGATTGSTTAQLVAAGLDPRALPRRPPSRGSP
jgi:hypothetical protein